MVQVDTLNLRRPRVASGGLLALFVAALVIGVAWRSISPLTATWEQPEYSHAWFILPFAMVIFASRLRASSQAGETWPGPVFALLSLITTIFAWATGSYTSFLYAAIVGLGAFVCASFGTRSMHHLAPPILYLFFMVPLPLAFYISASAHMQLWSSSLGMLVLSQLHVPASLDGNIISLGAKRLEVAEACSGLRYLFPLVSFACLIAMLTEDSIWKKIAVVASSIPVAVGMNALRIAFIAFLLHRFDIDTSDGPAHSFEGFFVFSLCILGLLIEVWFLLRLGRPRGRFVPLESLLPDQVSLRRLSHWPITSMSVVTAMLIFGSAIVALVLPPRTEFIPTRTPFALFPMELGDWHGSPQALDSETRSSLGLTDYLLANFQASSRDRAPINFYVAYYASQREGVHVHSPQLCIPGGGWSIMSQAVVDIPTASGASVRVRRVTIERNGVKQIVYYWFAERGRHITDEGKLKYYALRDALLDNRSDGALVRLVVPVQNNDENASDIQVFEFIRDISALLGPFLPV